MADKMNRLLAIKDRLKLQRQHIDELEKHMCVPDSFKLIQRARANAPPATKSLRRTRAARTLMLGSNRIGFEQGEDDLITLASGSPSQTV
jgi:hypothetical protein